MPELSFIGEKDTLVHLMVWDCLMPLPEILLPAYQREQ